MNSIPITIDIYRMGTLVDHVDYELDYSELEKICYDDSRESLTVDVQAMESIRIVEIDGTSFLNASYTECREYFLKNYGLNLQHI